MREMLELKRFSVERLFLAFPLLLYIGLFYYFMRAYIPIDLSFVLGLLMTPFLIRWQGRAAGYTYLILSLLLFVLLLFYRSSTLFYFAFGFGLIYLLERYLGRLNYLPIGLLIVLSPIFKYIAFTWSFPIRLQLTELAAQTLSLMGFDAAAQGNIIYMEGLPFSVDPACMGLRMLLLSLLMGLMIMAYYERREQKMLGGIEVLMALMLVLLLAVLANFSRLLALVIFAIMPGEWLHDFIGLASLLLYVVLPFYGLSTIYKGGSSLQIAALPIQLKKSILGLSYGLLLALLLAVGPQFLQKKIYHDEGLKALVVEGYTGAFTEIGVLKLEGPEALVYIKPPVGPLHSSHDPRICWQGSGYTFSQVKKEKIAGLEVYTAVLTKGVDRLYAAWWFDNGKLKTIDEWVWRWKRLFSTAGFRLINVNSHDPQLLEQEVKRFLDMSINH